MATNVIDCLFDRVSQLLESTLRPDFLRSMTRSETRLPSGEMGSKVLLNEPVHDRHNFSCKNSFTSLGNAAVGWEPRYDRCKCDGFWPRARHAIVRNFVTYDRSEKHLRPQLMPYVGSFGAGVITATWQPGNPDYLVKGYQSAVTQAWVGSLINVLGEFAPEISRKLRKNKNDDPDANALQQPIHLHVLIYCRRSN